MSSTRTAPIRVLLVDDDDVDREKLRRLLGQSGLPCEIWEVSSGNEALEWLREGRVDCALVDYRLGDISGTELARRIKRESRRPFPLIMVTGLGDERIAVEAMREGVYDYLPKVQLRPQQISKAIEGSLRWAELEGELAQTQERLTRLSMFDELSGLPNRNLFFDRLEQALRSGVRSGPPFALLMMDLDLFKEVNDRLGHDAGDKLLAEFGKRLLQLSRKADTYARIGGDEFAALLLGTYSIPGAIAVAERIGRAMQEPVVIDGQLVTLGVSIGISLFPVHGRDARTLLAGADEAMYRAKRGNRGYDVFTPRSCEKDASEFLITSHLDEALEQDELFLHFQPKVHLGTGDLVGVEALVRWQSPRLGLVGPSEFIPAAERSSLIRPMTYRVLEMALDQCRRWLDEGRSVPVAVNLSARVLEDERLSERVGEALKVRDLTPQMLTLELTETALMASASRAKEALRTLRSEGVGISIDDFGTGYTSFKYLRDFEISEIKIDKLFVSNLEGGRRDASIVQSIAALSHGLEIDLVAEGIESRDSCALLHRLGCDFGQGYGIGHPMPAEHLADWCRRRSFRPEAGAGFSSDTRTIVGGPSHAMESAPDYSAVAQSSLSGKTAS